MITEDEFIVLLEHAGLVESWQGTGEEFVRKKELLQWIESEGYEHFDGEFLCTNALNMDTDSFQSSSSSIPTSLKTEKILNSILQKEWLLPVETDNRDTQITRYRLHLSTVEAYQMYLNKDMNETTSQKCNDSVVQMVMSSSFIRYSSSDIDSGGLKITKETEQKSSQDAQSCDEESEAEANNKRVYSLTKASSHEVRKQMWQECFPMCAPSCRDAFFAFESKTVILYATLGLNLIQNGISTVPAFSRELKNIGINAADRSIITRFLAKAFPCD